jgi:cytochrome b561
LVGWAMVSASGSHAVIFGSLQLPRIAPFNADLYFVLRQTHSLVAFALVAVIAAHVSAVLWHTLTLRDGMLSRMGFAVGARSSGASVREEPETGGVSSADTHARGN